MIKATTNSTPARNIIAIISEGEDSLLFKAKSLEFSKDYSLSWEFFQGKEGYSNPQAVVLVVGGGVFGVMLSTCLNSSSFSTEG